MYTVHVHNSESSQLSHCRPLRSEIKQLYTRIDADGL